MSQVPARGTGWPRRWPRAAIRADVDAMAEAWVEALRAHLAPDAIRSIYVTGSSRRRWDTRLDYVPGTSDVDVHLWLRRGEDAARLDSIDVAVAIREAVERGFRERAPRPAHEPKSQLTIANRLHDEPTYVPSPAAAVTVLHGEPYPDRPPTAAERRRERERDRHNLQAHRAFVAAIPGRLVDRTGTRALRIADEMCWRVGPIAARVLSLAGWSYEDAWMANRTTLIAGLRDERHDDLADAVTAFYLAGWRCFADPADGAAPLDACLAGLRAITIGDEIASRPRRRRAR